MQTSQMLSKREVIDYIDNNIKHRHVIKLLKSKVEETQDEDKLKELLGNIKDIKEYSKAILRETQPMQFKWKALDETYQMYILEDYQTSSQNLYGSSIMDYSEGWPYVIGSDIIPNLHEIAKLYRYPTSEFGLNYGFMLEVELGQSIDEAVEQLVAHSSGYSTWQYVDQEIDFDQYDNEEIAELYKSIDYEHKSESELNDDIVWINK
jgi:hypothetical protein